MRKSVALALLVSAAVPATKAADLAFSDPANVKPMPQWAIGRVSRSPDLDALPGFQKPPAGFGVVPFYWWLGDTLTRERIGWQLEQMAGMGISGYQINYAHTDRGGQTYGLSFPSDPPLFSPAWWELTRWFMSEAKKQGAGISLSDYTLGLGQGWIVDELLRDHPDMSGQELRLVRGNPSPGALLTTNLAGESISIVPEKIPFSLDPMHPSSGPEYARRFFGIFEQQFPGEGGKGLNFFFSDELEFRVRGKLWNERFAAEFKRRKGYDLVPELPALFMDTGPRTPKIRLDYSDVKVALTEEGFFQPVFAWHQERGMTLGCDHGGRGRDVTEFGDYFRTQRWNQGPGADQPGLGKDVIKAKVASSIAHLYERPRVWLEGFYGSGWGTTSAGLVDATFANYAMGFNLLSFHGMYYSTHGGWWEWAPPDNTFRMPYWKHMRGFMDCVQRLSFLMSHGHHRCDVAILYPVAPVEAGMGGAEAVQAAFETGQHIYSRGVDFDFMDFESLDRAKIVGAELHVSGEVYRVLVLPGMKAIRFSTLRKAMEFKRAGGVVLAVGALPEASDRIGREDTELNAMVKTLFPDGPVKDVMTPLPGRDYDGPGYIQHRKVGRRDIYAIYNAPQDSEVFFRARGNVELWDPWSGSTRPLPIVAQTPEGTRLRLPLSQTDMQLIVFTPGDPVSVATTPETPMTTITLDGDWEFELQPISDNRFGDFHWPPTPGYLGAEVRQLWCTEGDQTNGPWRKVTCTFGPQFLKGETMPTTAPPQPSEPYEFSWRWGIENDPGHQGYHGLKEEVHDDFLAIGSMKQTATGTTYQSDGKETFFWTSLPSTRQTTAYAITGPIKPASVWLNHQPVSDNRLNLNAGANTLVLKFNRPGRTYFLVSTNSGKDAAEVKDLFASGAHWIWAQDRNLTECWFWKTFDLARLPGSARLRITCDNGYSVAVNGTHVGEGTRWESVQDYDITKALRVGSNEIVVQGSNTGDTAGLIAEIISPDFYLPTDRSWRVANSRQGSQSEAEQIALFSDSLWYKHPQGPPRLEPPRSEDRPRFKSGPLTMTWAGRSDLFPFDVRPNETAPVGWYRFDSPPGFRAMTLKARGKMRAWADGRPMTETGEGRFRVEQVSAKPVCVMLRVEQERGFYGGAALLEPIKLECDPGRIALGDWSKIDGLLSYSGGAWYRKTISVPGATRCVLDLGDVAASAEVRINGKTVGVKVAPPWTMDITPAVKPGQNRIEVLVCNTLANHYTTIPTRYRGSTRSGLLGPVALRLATE